MVASRNQRNMLSRSFGSSPNGSMEGYHTAGEVSQYLNPRASIAFASRPKSDLAKKHNMKPKTKGEVIHSNDFATRFGWSAVFVIRIKENIYVVEHWCPVSNSIKHDGVFFTAGEATKKAGEIMRSVKQTGESYSTNMFGNIGALGAGPMDVGLALAMASVWIGLDFPGAKAAAKQIKKIYNEPVPYIQNTLLFVGTGVILFRQMTTM